MKTIAVVAAALIGAVVIVLIAAWVFGVVFHNDEDGEW